MQIKIKGTKLDLTEEIKEYVQEKMDMLEKYLGDIKVMNCDVEVGVAVGGQKSGRIYKTEVNLNLAGEMLRVEKTEKDLYKSIDKVKDHLVLVIKKYKEKRYDKTKRVKENELELSV